MRDLNRSGEPGDPKQKPDPDPRFFGNPVGSWDSDTVHLEMVINDPKYYTRPLHFSRSWIRGLPGQGLTQYACNETSTGQADIGPGPGFIRPDGNRGYDPSAKLPDVPPELKAYESGGK